MTNVVESLKVRLHCKKCDAKFESFTRGVCNDADTLESVFAEIMKDAKIAHTKVSPNCTWNEDEIIATSAVRVAD